MTRTVTTGTRSALLAVALLALHVPAGTAREPAISRAAATGPAPAAAPTAPAPGSAPATGRPPTKSKPVSPPPLKVYAKALAPGWKVVATVAGRPVAWAARRAGVTLMRFQQGALRLELHPGFAEPGGGGWAYQNHITRLEDHRVIAAFNGGFKFSYGSVGFREGGRNAVPLEAGLGSVVTYRDGYTQIGAWGQGVPARGRAVLSVRQNLHLLIDHGELAGNLSSCVEACWGATLGGFTDVARSGIGITGSGQLVWAAGASLSPAGLAGALRGAGAVRAVELDINPEWVNGYLYLHTPSGPKASPLVPGQHGISGQLFTPYQRDFFTVVAR